MDSHRSLVKSFKYAFMGIGFMLKTSVNIPLYFTFTLVVVVFGIYFQISSYEIGWILIMALLVICMEMINTTIEEMVNLIKKEHSAEGKIVKDVAAGMVLLTTISYIIIVLFIFIPHIIKFFK